jgi:hypothetical protein
LRFHEIHIEAREMIIFDDTYAPAGVTSSDEFLRWRERNPRAFLINCKNSEYMIHYAECWHFTFKPDEDVSLTATKKVCSASRAELEKWLADQGIKDLRICQTCSPGLA